jgi:hypothetical protein
MGRRTTITKAMFERAGVHPEHGGVYSIEHEGDEKRAMREFRGGYTIGELEAVLADMRRVQQAIDAGKLETPPRPDFLALARAVLATEYDTPEREQAETVFCDAIREWLSEEAYDDLLDQTYKATAKEAVILSLRAVGVNPGDLD